MRAIQTGVKPAPRLAGNGGPRNNPAFAPKPHSAGFPDRRALQTDRQNCAIAGVGVQTEIDHLSLPTGMVGEVGE